MGNKEAELGIDMPYMLELVGIRQVFAVPSQEEVTVVKRGHGQVQSIPSGIVWHHMVFNVGIDDLNNLRLNW